MDKNLKGLKPELVWKHFAAICDIPHPSHEEDAIRAYIVKWAEELGLEELFGASNAVCAVEWASKIPSYLPESYATVTIEKLGENRRKITIRTPFEVKL